MYLCILFFLRGKGTTLYIPFCLCQYIISHLTSLLPCHKSATNQSIYNLGGPICMFRHFHIILYYFLFINHRLLAIGRYKDTTFF